MKLAFAHPFTMAADLLEDGIPVNDVKFIGIERFGESGIIGMILEFFQALFV